MGAAASGSRIVGNNNNVRQENTFVVGNAVTTSQANSVVLGNASADRTATTEATGTVDGVTYGTFAGQGSAAKGVVSVGSAGNERQIINVAAGNISATSTDAINGSQLFHVTRGLQNQISNTATHYYSVNDTGAVRVNPDPTNKTNLGATGTDALAAGMNASATGTKSVSMGYTTKAEGVGSVSMGALTTANGETSVASGYGATTANGATNAVSVGFETTANAKDSVSVGYKTRSGGDSSVAMGFDSTADGTLSMAVGRSAKTSATAEAAVAMGVSAAANAKDAVSVGHNTTSKAVSATAVGVSSIAGAAESVAMGRTAVTGDNATNAVSVGYQTNASAADSVSVGYKAASSGANAAALGQTVTAAGQDSVAMGASSTANAATSVAVGRLANVATGASNAVAMGRDAQIAANALNAVAIGGAVKANAEAATAVGHTATAGAKNSVAMGSSTTANGESSTAVGRGAQTATAAQNAVSVGFQTQANAADSVSVGRSTVAGAQYATAIGVSSQANAQHALAAGSSAIAGGSSSTAIGYNTNATVADAVALGSRSTANRAALANATAVVNPTVTANQVYTPGAAFAAEIAGTVKGTLGAVSVGNATSTRQIINVAAGTENTDAVNVAQLKAVASAAAAGQTHYFSVNSNLSGSNTNYANDGATGGNAIAVGLRSSATQTDALAVGVDSKALGNQSTALGTAANANQTGSTAVGNGAVANGISSLALGRSVTASGDEALAAGRSSTASGGQSIAVGPRAVANGASAVAIGHAASAIDTNSTAVGHQAHASGMGTALGYNAAATGLDSSISIGTESASTGSSSVAMGDWATAAGDRAVAIGAQISGSHTQGGATYASGTDSVAIGTRAAATATNAFALGLGAQATHADSVAIGSNSETSAPHTGNFTLNSSYTAAATAPTSVVSVGRVGGERQIQNVAAGVISATSTDAINGSQLYATNHYLGNLASTTASVLGGNAAVNGTGNITMTDIGGTGKTTVHEAIGAVNDKTATTPLVVADGKVVAPSSANENKLATAGDIANAINNSGFNLTAQGANGTLVNAGETVDLNNTDENIVIRKAATSNNVTFGLAPSITVGPSTGGNPITINGTAGTITGLSNTTFASGTTYTGGQAATQEQLTSLYSQVNTNVNAAKTEVVAGSNIEVTPSTGANGQSVYTVRTSATPTFTSVTAGGNVLNGTALTVNNNTVTNVNDAINQTAEQAFNPLTFAGDSGTNVTRKLGDTLNIKGGATTLTDNNIGVVADAATNTLTVKLAKDIDLGTTGSVKTGNTTVNNAGVTIANADPNKTVSLSGSGLNNGGNQITNVASGGTDATNAANIGDVQRAAAAAANTVSAGSSNVSVAPTTNANGSTNYAVSVAPAALQYTNTNTPAGGNTPNTDQFTQTNQVTLVGAGGDTNTGVTINNVAPGAVTSTSKQAVNGSQLHGVANSVKNVLGGNAALGTDGTISMSNIGGTGHNNVHDAIASLSSTVSGGWNLQANSDTPRTIAPGATVKVVDGRNTTVELSSGNELKVNVVDNPTFSGTVTAGGGLTVGAGQAVNMGGNRIQNVAAGINPTDAVNKSQLEAAVQGSVINVTNQINAVDARVTQVDNRVTNVDNRVTNVDNRVTQLGNLVGTNPTNPDGTRGTTTYDVEKQTTTTHTNLFDTVNEMNLRGIKYTHTKDNGEAPVLANAETNDSSAGADGSTAHGVNAIVDPGATNGTAMGRRARVRALHGVAIGNETEAGGESALAIGDGARALGKRSISIGTGNIVYGEGSGAMGDPTIINADNSYSIGNNNRIEAGSHDAFVLGNEVTATAANSVNLGSRSAAQTAVTPQTAGMADYSAANIDGVTYHYAGGTPAGVVSVGDVGEERRIQNVAAGQVSPTSTDAINGSQLYQTTAAINAVANRINVNHDKAMGGIASAMATAGLPQAYMPGKSMVAMGAATYQGRSAVAVGVSTISDNGHWVIKGSFNTNNHGHVGASVGAGYQW